MGNYFILRKVITIYKRSALILGPLIPILCYISLPNISILHDPLSKFGIEEKTQMVWILFNQVMSFTLLLMGLACNKHINCNIKRRLLNVLVITSTSCFALSGIIPMNFTIPHLTLAGIFFMTYVGYIFWYGYFHRKEKISLSIWSVLLTLCPVISIFVTFLMGISYGSFEVVFIASVVIWNLLMILYKKDC